MLILINKLDWDSKRIGHREESDSFIRFKELFINSESGFPEVIVFMIGEEEVIWDGVDNMEEGFEEELIIAMVITVKIVV